MPKSKRPPNGLFQLKITLRDVRPPIWRRLLMPTNGTFGDLSDAILISVGWGGGHLHEFDTGEGLIGDPEMSDDPSVANEEKTKLESVLYEKAKVKYIYDFGDGWEHDVVVEKVLPWDPAMAGQCTGGERSGPPDDVGGAYGYMEFLEAMRDPSHEMHAELTEWFRSLYGAAKFDPDFFDPEPVNTVLKQRFA